MADKNIVKTKRNSIDNTFSPPNRLSIVEQNRIYNDSIDGNNDNLTDFMLLTKSCSKMKVFSNSSHYYQSKLSTRLSNHMPSSATALPARYLLLSCSIRISKY